MGCISKLYDTDRAERSLNMMGNEKERSVLRISHILLSGKIPIHRFREVVIPKLHSVQCTNAGIRFHPHFQVVSCVECESPSGGILIKQRKIVADQVKLFPGVSPIE